MNENVLYIVDEFKKLVIDSKVFFYPNFPEKKFKNALENYAFIKDGETPLVLIDDTVFGSSKTGMLITDSSIYAKIDFEDRIEVNLSEIDILNFGGVITNKIYINDKISCAFTQANKNSIILIIKMLQKIIDVIKIENIRIDQDINTTKKNPINKLFNFIFERDYKSTIDNDIIFLVAIVSMIASMIKSNEKMIDEKIENTFVIFEEFEIKEEVILTKIFDYVQNDDFSIYDYASLYAEILEIDVRKSIYYYLWKVVVCDDGLLSSDEKILKEIPEFFKLPDKEFYENLNYFLEDDEEEDDDEFTDIEASYLILNCNVNDSMEVIKKSYIKLIKEYHPDKIQSKELPDAFIVFATEQTQKINNAYENIKNYKNKN